MKPHAKPNEKPDRTPLPPPPRGPSGRRGIPAPFWHIPRTFRGPMGSSNYGPSGAAARMASPPHQFQHTPHTFRGPQGAAPNKGFQWARPPSGAPPPPTISASHPSPPKTIFTTTALLTSANGWVSFRQAHSGAGSAGGRLCWKPRFQRPVMDDGKSIA